MSLIDTHCHLDDERLRADLAETLERARQAGVIHVLGLGTTAPDAALAAAFVVIGLVQAVAYPIADGWLGELFVLGTTLPLAWRRTRPIEAALVASAFWLIPLEPTL